MKESRNLEVLANQGSALLSRAVLQDLLLCDQSKVTRNGCRSSVRILRAGEEHLIIIIFGNEVGGGDPITRLTLDSIDCNLERRVWGALHHAGKAYAGMERIVAE